MFGGENNWKNNGFRNPDLKNTMFFNDFPAKTLKNKWFCKVRKRKPLKKQLVFNDFQCRIEKHCVFIDFSIRKSGFLRINKKSIVYITSLIWKMKKQIASNLSGFVEIPKIGFRRIKNNWKTLCFLSFRVKIIEKQIVLQGFAAENIEQTNCLSMFGGENHWKNNCFRTPDIKNTMFFNDFRAKTLKNKWFCKVSEAENHWKNNGFSMFGGENHWKNNGFRTPDIKKHNVFQWFSGKKNHWKTNGFANSGGENALKKQWFWHSNVRKRKTIGKTIVSHSVWQVKKQCFAMFRWSKTLKNHGFARFRGRKPFKNNGFRNPDIKNTMFFNDFGCRNIEKPMVLQGSVTKKRCEFTNGFSMFGAQKTLNEWFPDPVKKGCVLQCFVVSMSRKH